MSYLELSDEMLDSDDIFNNLNKVEWVDYLTKF